MLSCIQLTFLETLSIDVLTVSVTQPFLELRRNKYLEHENETGLSIVIVVAVSVAVISMPAIKAMLLTVVLL